MLFTIQSRSSFKFKIDYLLVDAIFLLSQKRKRPTGTPSLFEKHCVCDVRFEFVVVFFDLATITLTSLQPGQDVAE